MWTVPVRGNNSTRRNLIASHPQATAVLCHRHRCLTSSCHYMLMQFLGMLRTGLISDVMFLCNPSEGVFHSLVALGRDVCGHRCTVHGGLTSAVIDETTGRRGKMRRGSTSSRPCQLESSHSQHLPQPGDGMLHSAAWAVISSWHKPLTAALAATLGILMATSDPG